MADRPVITTVPAGGVYDTDTLNTNFTKLQEAYDNLLGRAGTAGTANSMTGDLDMAGFMIRNAAQISTIGGPTEVVGNIAGLKQVQNVEGSIVIVLGYYSPNDGGGGVFVWDGTDPSAADESIDSQGRLVIVDSSGRRWKSFNTLWTIEPEKYGVKSDGSDTTAAWQALITKINASTAPSLTVKLAPSGVYNITSNWTLTRSNVKFVGNGATFIGGGRAWIFGQKGARIRNVSMIGCNFGLGDGAAQLGPYFKWCDFPQLSDCVNDGPTGTAFDFHFCVDARITNVKNIGSRVTGASIGLLLYHCNDTIVNGFALVDGCWNYGIQIKGGMNNRINNPSASGFATCSTMTVSGTETFTRGSTVTGASSGATGVVLYFTSARLLYVRVTSGEFINGEVVSQTGASGTTSSVARKVPNIFCRDRGDAPWSGSTSYQILDYPFDTLDYNIPDERRAAKGTIWTGAVMDELSDVPILYIGQEAYDCSFTNFKGYGTIACNKTQGSVRLHYTDRGNTAFVAGNLVVGATSGAEGVIELVIPNNITTDDGTGIVYFNIANDALVFKNRIGTLDPSTTITGATSGATAVIKYVTLFDDENGTATSGRLLLRSVSGTWIAGEDILVGGEIRATTVTGVVNSVSGNFIDGEDLEVSNVPIAKADGTQIVTVAGDRNFKIGNGYVSNSQGAGVVVQGIDETDRLDGVEISNVTIENAFTHGVLISAANAPKLSELTVINPAIRTGTYYGYFFVKVKDLLFFNSNAIDNRDTPTMSIGAALSLDQDLINPTITGFKSQGHTLRPTSFWVAGQYAGNPPDGTGTTTTDTANNSFLRTQIPTNKTVDITVTALARQSDGSNRAIYKSRQAAYHNGTGAVLQGSQEDIVVEESDSTWGGLSFAVSGHELRTVVTGKAATEINWTLYQDVKVLD